MARDEVVEKLAQPVRRLACSKCGVSFDVAELPMLSPVDCPSCGKAQHVPARLESFLLIECLGRGGMASVYKAYDETLGRLVAIKILRASVEQGESSVDSFIREARAAAQLNHRNIVQVYTVGHTKGQAFLVMELLAGGKLDEMIAADRQLDEVRVLEIGIGIAEGLKSANAIGLIHGDIKPANILFDREGTPKLADFGLARFKGSAAANNEVWGTPYYIAPEKVRKQKEDHRSDIYSLGATLYHALGGQPPFDGRTATDVVVARLKEPPIRIETLRPNVRSATTRVISRMLEVDRMRRYPTYDSLLADMRSAVEEIKANPVTLSGPRRGSDKRPRAKSGAKKSKGPWLIGAATLLIAIAGLVFWRLSGDRAPGEETPIVVPVDPGPEAPPPPVEVDLSTLQPFSASEGEALADIVRRISLTTTSRIETELLDGFRALPALHAGRPWYTLWYAFVVWLNGDSEEAGRRVRALRERSFEPQEGGGMAPGVLTQALAHVIAAEPFDPPGRRRPDPVIETDEPADAPEPDGGEAEADDGEADPAEGEAVDEGGEPAAEEEPDAPAETEEEPADAADADRELPDVDLPEWYLDLADFVLGIRELFHTETRGIGRLRLQRFLEAPVDADIPWVYAGRDVAERWLERMERWEAFVDGLGDQVERGEGNEVLDRIQQLADTPEWGGLSREITAARSRVRTLIRDHDRRLDRERQTAEAAALQAQIEQDRAVMEASRVPVEAAVRRMQFGQALADWTRRTEGIRAEEVRAEALAMRDLLAWLDGVKAFLGREARARPYTRAQAQLRGDVVDADENGVSIALAGGVGSFQRTWQQVGPRVFTDMASFYLGSTSASEADRGQWAAGLALFFQFNNAERPAASAARNAVRWNPDVAESLRRALPDVLAQDEPDE